MLLWKAASRVTRRSLLHRWLNWDVGWQRHVSSIHKMEASEIYPRTYNATDWIEVILFNLHKHMEGSYESNPVCSGIWKRLSCWKKACTDDEAVVDFYNMLDAQTKVAIDVVSCSNG